MPARIQTNFLGFARKERRGTHVLLSVILMLCAFPFLLPFLYKGSMAGQVSIDSSLARLQIKKEAVARTSKKYPAQFVEDDRRPYDHPSSYASYDHSLKGELFYFDPNILSEAGWKKLGLRDKTIATILNYRNKGGKFKQAEDIKKIWGLFPDEAERLMPFVRISETENNSPGFHEHTAYPNREKYEPRTYNIVNINSADTNALIALPGIGEKLSARIINFRNKLGGFYSVEQVGETFGLPDSSFQQIKPYLQLNGELKKININTATLEELKAHPYIRYHLANAIVEYRKQHGAYKSTDDLLKIMIMSAEQLKKMLPYLQL
jgi:competence protein ComEA